MKLDDIGEFTFNENDDWYYSEEKVIPAMDNLKCQFVLVGYEEKNKAKYREAIINLLKNDRFSWVAAEKYIFKYYSEIKEQYKDLDIKIPNIQNEKDIWGYIKFGTELLVMIREDDEIAYIVFGCECDWAKEHGLQIVFKNGNIINKVGPYDGHLTNSDAYDNPAYEDVVYLSINR